MFWGDFLSFADFFFFFKINSKRNFSKCQIVLNQISQPDLSPKSYQQMTLAVKELRGWEGGGGVVKEYTVMWSKTFQVYRALSIKHSHSTAVLYV